jgi:hypothetical protein
MLLSASDGCWTKTYLWRPGDASTCTAPHRGNVIIVAAHGAGSARAEGGKWRRPAIATAISLALLPPFVTALTAVA